jgi:hypothetical protein
MKLPISLAWFAAISLAGGQVGGLTPQDREDLLKRLAEIRDAADSQLEARFRVAISAFRTAMASEDAAFSLYMNSVEKVDFTDQGKSGQDFRDWRRQNEERLKDPAFRRALRHQLRWLVLSLQATSEKADRAQLATDAQQIVDSIAGDAEKLTGHQNILNQDVTGSVFARAYDIGRVNVENWVLAPGRIGQVYEQIILPPHRTLLRHASLRSGWTKRIQQETALSEHWGGGTDRRNGRIGMASATRSPEFEKFLAEEVPTLQWQMEVDVFQHGDPLGAATRMIEHLKKNPGHASLREWAAELEDMLKVGAAPAPSAPPPAEPPPPPPPANEPAPAGEESIFIE